MHKFEIEISLPVSKYFSFEGVLEFELRAYTLSSATSTFL
jgi:hypothetical protein